MRFDFDPGKLLYAFGVVLAVAALVYFVRDLVFGLSITVKAVLLFLGFVAFLVAGVATDRDLLDVVAFALAGVTYLVFLGYVATRYDLTETGTFLLLAVSAALFIGLGYLQREERLAITLRAARYVGIGLLVTSLVLVGFDAAGGGVTYEYDVVDSVTVDYDTDDGPWVTIGTMTATNEFVLRRPFDPPSLRGCVVTEAGPVEYGTYVEYVGADRNAGFPSALDGGESVTADMETYIEPENNQTGTVTYDVVRRDSCPDQVANPTFVLVVDRDST